MVLKVKRRLFEAGFEEIGSWSSSFAPSIIRVGQYVNMFGVNSPDIDPIEDRYPTISLACFFRKS
jgi:hypothetical protein